MRMAVAAALFALAAAPAAAQVTVAAGEAVTVRVAEDAKTAPDILERSPAQWNALDVESARQLVSLDAAGDPAASGPNMIPVFSDTPAPPIPTGALRFKILSIAGRHTILVIENGLEQGLVYRATLSSGGQEAATDVCLVMPNRRGYEHWPYPIDRIVLSDLRLVAWQEGDPVPCE